MKTPALVRIDDDDPCLGGYSVSLPLWEIVIGPRVFLSRAYNEVFEQHGNLDWYGIFADDVVPETPGWDRALIDAAGRDGVAYGDDGIASPTHFVIGGDLAREIGWLALPGLERTYIDTVWHDIAVQRNVLRFLPDVRMPHLHFSNRRALMDSTYRKSGKNKDRALYWAWREDTR